MNEFYLTVLGVLFIFFIGVIRLLKSKLSSLESHNNSLRKEISSLQKANEELEQCVKAQNETIQVTNCKITSIEEELKNHEENLRKILESNLTSIPWLSGMMSDFLTYDLEIEAKKLDWGSNVKRSDKVKSIRALREETKEKIEAAKYAIYQLEYLKKLFPIIEEVIETDYKNLDMGIQITDSQDPVKEYLSDDEWKSLSTTEKNQLALDRYVQSRSKTKWQIGRDYELSVAYEYLKSGFTVDTYGAHMKLEDMGRDIIASRNGKVQIIQCKYWSKDKTIHEKHIFQLFGSVITYCIENNLNHNQVKGVFVTNTKLSDVANRMANYLGIHISENHPMIDFPRIKCNINYDSAGIRTQIYHLPMDEQYDATKISKPGECYAFTVAEAESKGFRRAYKHLFS